MATEAACHIVDLSAAEAKLAALIGAGEADRRR
jgi:hypothetical protein